MELPSLKISPQEQFSHFPLLQKKVIIKYIKRTYIIYINTLNFTNRRQISIRFIGLQLGYHSINAIFGNIKITIMSRITYFDLLILICDLKHKISTIQLKYLMPMRYALC